MPRDLDKRCYRKGVEIPHGVPTRSAQVILGPEFESELGMRFFGDGFQFKFLSTQVELAAIRLLPSAALLGQKIPAMQVIELKAPGDVEIRSDARDLGFH